MHCGALLFYRQSFLCFVWMSLNKYTLTEYRVNVLLVFVSCCFYNVCRLQMLGSVPSDLNVICFCKSLIVRQVFVRNLLVRINY